MNHGIGILTLKASLATRVAWDTRLTITTMRGEDGLVQYHGCRGLTAIIEIVWQIDW